jgi:hypothetical protein
MKIATCIQAVLKFCFSNLKGFNINLTDILMYTIEIGSGSTIHILSSKTDVSGI